MICPTIGKRATAADSKLLAPFFRSIGSSTYLATTRLVYAGPSLPDRETMKSVIAHRCSGVRLSANDGIGEPLSPVLIVRKISSRDGPPRKVQLCARFAARIGCPKSSVSVGAEGPSPRPRLPWHFRQPVSTYSFFPSSIDSLDAVGALGSSIGFGTFSPLEKLGEKVVMK